MIGRTPGYIVAVRPLRGGAITDFEITERMIRLLLQRVGVSRFNRPAGRHLRAVGDHRGRAARRHRGRPPGRRRRRQPHRAADGRGDRRRAADRRAGRQHGHRHRRRHRARRRVIRLGGIVALEAVRVGSFDIDAAIQTYIRREHGIAIGERTAEEIKVAIGSADPTDDEYQAEVRGRDLMSGPAQDGRADARGGPRRHRGRRSSSIIASVVRCLGQGAARAGPGLPRQRHVPRRRRRAAARASTERIERETEVPVQARRRCRSRPSCSAPATASSTTTRSRACSWSRGPRVPADRSAAKPRRRRLAQVTVPGRMGTLLGVRGRQRALRRRRRPRRPDLHRRRGPDLRPDRPERCGQDDPVQRHQPALRADRRARSPSPARTCWPCPPTASPSSASPARSRTWPSSPACPCWTTS